MLPSLMLSDPPTAHPVLPSLAKVTDLSVAGARKRFWVQSSPPLVVLRIMLLPDPPTAHPVLSSLAKVTDLSVADVGEVLGDQFSPPSVVLRTMPRRLLPLHPTAHPV